MEQSRSSQAYSHLVKNLPVIYWLKIFLSVSQEPAIGPYSIRNEFKFSLSLRCILILSYRLPLFLRSGLLISVFATNIFMHLLYVPCVLHSRLSQIS